MRHGYGVRTSAAFGIASHSRGGEGRRPSMSSLQPGVEEPVKMSSSMSNGGASAAGGTKDNAELRGGFVLKSRSDDAPVRRRSLVERTGMKNLMQVAFFRIKYIFSSFNDCSSKTCRRLHFCVYLKLVVYDFWMAPNTPPGAPGLHCCCLSQSSTRICTFPFLQIK